MTQHGGLHVPIMAASNSKLSSFSSVCNTSFKQSYMKLPSDGLVAYREANRMLRDRFYNVDELYNRPAMRTIYIVDHQCRPYYDHRFHHSSSYLAFWQLLMTNADGLFAAQPSPSFLSSFTTICSASSKPSSDIRANSENDMRATTSTNRSSRATPQSSIFRHLLQWLAHGGRAAGCDIRLGSRQTRASSGQSLRNVSQLAS